MNATEKRESNYKKRNEIMKALEKALDYFADRPSMHNFDKTIHIIVELERAGYTITRKKVKEIKESEAPCLNPYDDEESAN